MPVDLFQIAREVVAELAGASPPARPSREEAHHRSALEREARRFLRELHPDSQEAMWFDALAESYPTRLEAAIAYIDEVKR